MSNQTEHLGIRLPDGTREKLEKKAQKEGFINKSEYVRDLIRKDLEAQA